MSVALVPHALIIVMLIKIIYALFDSIYVLGQIFRPQMIGMKMMLLWPISWCHTLIIDAGHSNNTFSGSLCTAIFRLWIL